MDRERDLNPSQFQDYGQALAAIEKEPLAALAQPSDTLNEALSGSHNFAALTDRVREPVGSAVANDIRIVRLGDILLSKAADAQTDLRSNFYYYLALEADNLADGLISRSNLITLHEILKKNDWQAHPGALGDYLKLSGLYQNASYLEPRWMFYLKNIHGK